MGRVGPGGRAAAGRVCACEWWACVSVCGTVKSKGERALPSAARSGSRQRRFSLKKFQISLPSARSDGTRQSTPLYRVSPDLALGKDFFFD